MMLDQVNMHQSPVCLTNEGLPTGESEGEGLLIGASEGEGLLLRGVRVGLLTVARTTKNNIAGSSSHCG